MTRKCLVLVLAVVLIVWKPMQIGYELPDDLERTSSPFDFVQWTRGSDLAELDSTSVYAVFNHTIRLRFTFRTEERLVLDSAGIYDSAGRPWFDVDVASNGHMINQYPENDSSRSASPEATLRDTDGDGIVDWKKDWETGDNSCAQNAVTWGPCVDRSSADPTEPQHSDR